MSSNGLRRTDSPLGYVNEHPVVFSLATGGLLAGLAGTLSPHLIESSSLYQVLDAGELRIWLVMHALGAAMFIAGVLRMSPRLEASGCALLSATFAVTVIATLNVIGVTAITGALWLGCAAIGFAWRCRVLLGLYPRETA